MVNKTIVVAGGGHAGIEAACAIARMGGKCVFITLDLGALGRLSCNPAVGGLAKSHLVKEIDVFGGVMGWAADLSSLQFKTLNKTKGRAVWSLRAQVDKKKYPKVVKKCVDSFKKITFLEDEVVGVKIKNNKVVGVSTKSGSFVDCGSCIITCGTFLNGLIHIGSSSFKAGRMGERGSYGLTENLIDLGFKSGRLKTGTPPRISRGSVDFSKTHSAPGDDVYDSFSLFSSNPTFKQEECFLVHTNKNTHQIIQDNILSSAMFSGKIQGVGPRYCPSVEDKINRFKDRDSHHLFIEPEWSNSNQLYLNGFSTSLPESVQIKALQTIKAFKNVKLVRPGYAIEYDFFPPRQLKRTLESKEISGLFFAGQINGTSGYEEAAAQGLVAGINSFRLISGLSPLILNRSDSYIGVMIDDLTTSHLDEPYRMFTSRAEHRLFLRSDNAISRLYKQSFSMNVLSIKQKRGFEKYLQTYRQIQKSVDKMSVVVNNKKQPLRSVVKDPKSSLFSFIKRGDFSKFSFFNKALFELETSIKYEGYIKNEKDRILKNISLENLIIPKNINYSSFPGLSNESKERLSAVQPETLGQASRIFGVRPTDISLIGVYIKNKKVSRETKLSNLS